ncbi:restriction endonuclease subunit S [Neisseria sp.]
MNKQQEPHLRFKGFTGEWKNKTLGDLGRVEMCRRIFKEQTQPSGEIPFFKIGTFGQEPDAFISSELFEEYRQKYPYPKKGDILISAAGTIGRTVEFSGENAYFQDSNIVWLRFDESQITSTFLNITYQNIKWGLEGSTIKRLYNSDLLSAEITLPSFPEQTHLGLFFRRLDSQIAESRAVLEKSRQLKKAMLAKMFPANSEKIPKIRFKGFEGEWEEKMLGENANFTKGCGYSKSDLTEDGFPIILYGRLYTQYENIIEDVDTFVSYDDNALKSQGNEVIMPASGETAEDIVRASAVYQRGVILGGDLNVITPNKEISSTFLALTLTNGKNRQELAKKAQGKSVVHLRNDDLKSCKILFPSLAEQTQIGNFFRQLDETIVLQSAEVEKLNQLKKGLLAAMLV